MPIIRDHEILIKKELKKITKFIIEQYKLISNAVEKKDFSKLSKVFISENEIKEILNNSMELTIEAFSFAPLGKDLRRNISYTLINRLLAEISHNSINITTYIIKIEQFEFNLNWVNEISEKIIRRLELIDKLFTTENVEDANKIIFKDKSINETYKKELGTWSKKIDSIKEKINNKEKNEIIQGFILTIKNFEQVGDSIKKIAESSLFISTGRINW